MINLRIWNKFIFLVCMIYIILAIISLNNDGYLSLLTSILLTAMILLYGILNFETL